MEVKEEESTAPESNATGTVPLASTGLSKQDLDVMLGVLHRLSNYRDKEYVMAPFLPFVELASGADYVLSGRDVSKDFQRIVNRRQLPDYFEIIKEPVAFSTLRVCLYSLYVCTSRRAHSIHRPKSARNNTLVSRNMFEILL